jgi:hypothetical protein
MPDDKMEEAVSKANRRIDRANSVCDVVHRIECGTFTGLIADILVQPDTRIVVYHDIWVVNQIGPMGTDEKAHCHIVRYFGSISSEPKGNPDDFSAVSTVTALEDVHSSRRSDTNVMVPHYFPPPRQAPNVASFADLDPSVLMNNISPTNSSHRSVLERGKNSGEPVGMWNGIVINEYNYVCACCLDPSP